MSVTIPEKLKDLLAWEKKAFAQLALVKKDGTPHVTPIWFDCDGTHIIFNTARGRVKDKIMRRRARVAVSISDPADPYRHLEIGGRIVEETEEGARQMIDHLSQKYRGKNYEWYKGETRVTYKVLPDHVTQK